MADTENRQKQSGFWVERSHGEDFFDADVAISFLLHFGVSSNELVGDGSITN
jgi:hypothetical protein